MGNGRAKKKSRTQGNAAPLWRFRHASEYEGHTFGNPGTYATPRSIESLVRESAQNSLDADTGSGVFMRYTLFELPPGCKRRAKLMKALRYETQLKPHLQAASKTAGAKQIGVKLAGGIEEIDSDQDVLRLLRIEDFGGRGLKGDEFESSESFAALVRDNLNSQKAADTAGGSFGIGSKTLWASSRILTTLFASVLENEEKKGVRLIGKADLSFHSGADETQFGYAGPGWFGEGKGKDGAISFWVRPDDDLLRDLLLTRVAPEGEAETGTSILIIGFHDPKSDDEKGGEIAERFARALAEDFWPAMLVEQLRVDVEHYVGDATKPSHSETIDPKKYVPSFAAAFERHRANDVDEILENPGDTVSVQVQLVIPATRPNAGLEFDHDELAAECRLVIRLADPDSVDSRLTDHVGFTRGRGMITQYVRKRNLAAGARPYHAVLLAGTVLGDDDDTLRAAEAFLRFSEPPAHDRWEINEDLKSRYAHGVGRKLERFHEAITEQLRKFVAAAPTESSEGPDILREIFRFRRRPQPVKAKLALTKSNLRRDGNKYHVSGTVQIEEGGPRTFAPVLSIVKESGRPLKVEWHKLSSPMATQDNGALIADAGADKVRFEGTAIIDIPGLDPDRTAVQLAVSPVRRSEQ